MLKYTYNNSMALVCHVMKKTSIVSSGVNLFLLVRLLRCSSALAQCTHTEERTQPIHSSSWQIIQRSDMKKDTNWVLVLFC